MQVDLYNGRKTVVVVVYYYYTVIHNYGNPWFLLYSL